MPPSYRKFARVKRRVTLTFLAVVALLLLAAVGAGCAFSAPTWKGAATAHFNGQKFFTPGAPPKVAGFDGAGIAALLKWQATRKPGIWRAFHHEEPGPPPPYEVNGGAMRVTFINHATTLIQMDGVNVLTDPIWGERTSPVSFAGPQRVRPPGIKFEALPRIDVVVLSHNHYDHMDAETLKRIGATWPGAQFFAGLGNGPYLKSLGLVNVTELDWWESRDVRGVKIHSVPNQHFSNRGLVDSDGTLWSAWVVEGPAGRAFFGGDTAYGPHFKETAARLGPMRLSVLPIGAYKPEWVMAPIHMGPRDAVQAALDLQSTMAVPMHFGTFNLADDGETEAVEVLVDELKTKPAPFEVLGFGEGRDVP